MNTRDASVLLLYNWYGDRSMELENLISEKNFHGAEAVCSGLFGIHIYTAKSGQSCPTLCSLIDGSPPGSPVPGILQARTLEWVAISFSNAWKWKVKVKSLSRPTLCNPMDCSPPGSSIHGIFQARVLEWGAIAFSILKDRTMSYFYLLNSSEYHWFKRRLHQLFPYWVMPFFPNLSPSFVLRYKTKITLNSI